MLLACSPSNELPRIARNEPQIKATVVTIQSLIQPVNKTFTHSLFIANDLARSGDEVDSWRLFDLKQNRVTFVDDIAKTYRTEDVSLRLTKLASPAGPRRVVNGAETVEMQVRMGRYLRSLWIAEHPAIPPQLFAMMQDETADEALRNVRGFPMADHAELPYGNTKLVIDRNVIKVEQRNVPKSWLTIPAGYRNLTVPAVSPPPVSSPPPGRATPGAGSQSSATGRTAP